MKVLVVEPMKKCYTKEINGLEEMQALVGGYIQAIYPFPDKAAVVCNEEGKNLGLPFNRPLFDENDLPYDIICGTFFVAGLGVEDFVSLTEEQIRRYKEHYDRVMVLTATKETTPQHKPPIHTNTDVVWNGEHGGAYDQLRPDQHRRCFCLRKAGTYSRQSGAGAEQL